MASTSIDYAKYVGIDSLPAAIIFAVLYVPLVVFYIIQAVKRPTYVFIVLSLFCTLRVTGFILRAVLAGSSSVGSNLNVLIAEEVIYNTGFFGVLYSTYTLVLDRGILTPPFELPGVLSIISRISRNRHLIRIILIVAVALGIVGAVDTLQGGSSSSISLGMTLRKVSVFIFLVVAILVVLETLCLAMAQSTSNRSEGDSIELGSSMRYVKEPRFGFAGPNGVFVLGIISLLLVTREAFFAATIGSSSAARQAKANDEALYYPLAALTEFLAVLLCALPGLVPPKRELHAYSGH